MSFHAYIRVEPVKCVGDLKKAIADLPDDMPIPEHWKGNGRVVCVKILKEQGKRRAKPYLEFDEDYPEDIEESRAIIAAKSPTA